MRGLQPLPRLWLFSDARNRDTLFQSVKRLPKGSGIVFRDYDLPASEREERFRRTALLSRQIGLVLLVAGDPVRGESWLADGGHNRRLSTGGLYSRSVHNGDELAEAIRQRTDLVFISPIFRTASHPGTPVLGVARALAFAAAAPMPAMALGGMTKKGFESLGKRGFYGWGAIDALS